MVLIGLGAVLGGIKYQLGTFIDMRPGFFPAAVGVALILVGVVIAATARPTHPKSPAISLQWRSWGCIIGSLVAFIVLSAYGGLIVASFAVVFIAALGDRQNKVSQAFWLAVAMTVIGVILFWWALKVQLPLWHWGYR